MSCTPAFLHIKIFCSNMGLPPNSIIGLGIVSVNEPSLSPLPAAKINAFNLFDGFPFHFIFLEIRMRH